MAVARRIRRRGWMNAANKTNQSQDTRRPVTPPLAVRSRAPAPLAEAAAYVFDVEGTLIDNVLPSLNCWVQTLAEFGFSFRTADLHRYSGMDVEELLARLLPHGEGRELADFVLSKYQWRYRAEVLPNIRAFPGTRELISGLKERGARVGLITMAREEELARYRTAMNVDDLVDTFVTGEDVKRGMPHPDLLSAALKRLGLHHPADAVLIGDTPCDAEAAHQARMRSVGMLSGLFPRSDLTNAGCGAVFLDARSLHAALAVASAA